MCLSLSFWRAVGVRHSFDGVAVRLYTHNRHTNYFSDTLAQVLVAGGHNVALVLADPLYYAVIGVGSLVHAGQTLEARIFGYSKGNAKVLT